MEEIRINLDKFSSLKEAFLNHFCEGSEMLYLYDTRSKENVYISGGHIADYHRFGVVVLPMYGKVDVVFFSDDREKLESILILLLDISNANN